jgi:CubicO group peptidase (beta-lactamase class C family)
MNATLRTTCFLAAAVILSAPLLSRSAGAQAALPEPVALRVDSVFAMYTRPLSPGCALGVVHDGQLVYARGYGMADLEHDVRITPSSIFHVASISKQFAAFSILLLDRDGKLSLDDDIRKHLPAVPDFGHRITIRHLIHHTSGLRDQWQLLSLSGWRADDPKSERDILWLVSRQRALNFTPGAEHLYSNTGFTLLGTIVRRVSGKSLREFTTQRIFEPLGMTATHFHDDHTMLVPGRTSAYAPAGGGARGGRGGAAPSVSDYRISIPVFDNAGATSLFTTVEDMAKWERNFLQPTVGDARMVEQMYERGRLNDGSTIPYAFALSHGELRGLRTIGHSGSDAGYRADYVRFPDQRYAFATFCNIGTANPAALNRNVAAIVLADLMGAVPVTGGRGAAPPPRAVAMEAAELRRYAGVYVDTIGESFRALVFHDSTGTLHASGTANAPQLVHIGNEEFVAQVGANTLRVKFHRDARGIQGLSDSGSAVVFVRRPPPRSSLSEYAGRYRSEELDVEWVFAASDSSLVLSVRREPEQRLRPVYDDGFSAGAAVVRFTRDSAGRITGFLYSAGRVRHLRFDRRAQ